MEAQLELESLVVAEWELRVVKWWWAAQYFLVQRLRLALVLLESQ